MAILKAKHHPVIFQFFKHYAIWIVKRKFSPIRIIGSFEDKNLPLVLISNHISWWDGFWAMYLNVKILKRKFHFMMLENQLRKYWYFNYSGGFSVKRGSKSMVETILYASELLEDQKNIVLIFPQGEIQSMHVQHFKFEKGIDRILKNKEGKVQVLFLANLVDYFSKSKPGLFMYITELTGSVFDVKTISGRYCEFYEQCVENQNKIIRWI